MNSLPFISHHLFVAAIGNDGHAHEKPRRHPELATDRIDCSSPIPLELLDGTQPMPKGATRPLRASATQVRI